MKPDEEVLALWVEDDLSGELQAELDRWAADHSEWLERRDRAQRFIDMATNAMRFGDLSGSPTPIYDPLTGIQDMNDSGYARDREPFPGNMVPRSRIDSGVSAMIHDPAFPDPNNIGNLLGGNGGSLGGCGEADGGGSDGGGGNVGGSGRLVRIHKL